jgi:hypothetical protein
MKEFTAIVTSLGAYVHITLAFGADYSRHLYTHIFVFYYLIK